MVEAPRYIEEAVAAATKIARGRGVSREDLLRTMLPTAKQSELHDALALASEAVHGACGVAARVNAGEMTEEEGFAALVKCLPYLRGEIVRKVYHYAFFVVH